MARDTRKDALRRICKALAIARQHDLLAEKFDKQALEILDAERARLAPQEWEAFKAELGLDQQVIEALRATISEEERHRRSETLVA